MAKKMTTAIRRHVVKLTGLIKRWRRHNPSTPSAPSDIPPGHVVIMVGLDRKRFVVRSKQLSHPAFLRLLDDAEEEYDFNYADGPISIPCDVSAFSEALRLSGAPIPVQQAPLISI